MPASVPIYIEMANVSSLDSTLVQTRCLVDAFAISEPFGWDLSRLLASQDLRSPIQIVAIHLQALSDGSINNTDFQFDDRKKVRHNMDRSGRITSSVQADLEPLDNRTVQHLLVQYFLDSNNESVVSSPDCSFAILNVFVRVFADQLRAFTNSGFLKVEALASMGIELAQRMSVREKIVHAVMRVACDFSTRSISTAKTNQRLNLGGTDAISAQDLLDRYNAGANSWEESKHLLVIFQRQNQGNALSALYRRETPVPAEITNLLSLQTAEGDDAIKPFVNLEPAELQQELEKIARTNQSELTDLESGYALTSDNLLKMALVILRVKARIPVVREH